MSSRTVFVQKGAWVDLAAAASPALVEGGVYILEWSARSIGYLRLTYDGTAPDVSAIGVKVWARNHPDVDPTSFEVPAAPAKIWLRLVEADANVEITPAGEGGDGSTAA